MLDNAALLIKDQQLSDNHWQLIDKEQVIDLSSVADSDHIILPFARWQENQSIVLGKANIGLWLDSDESAEPLASVCHDVPLIAINFPVFSDGRGYSYARTLRDHFAYRGEIRAIGDVLPDQMYFYQRCGFNSFLLRSDVNPETAINCLNDFSLSYQAGSDQRTPIFHQR
jgi:uncharacterized protein (DUF934 family)